MPPAYSPNRQGCLSCGIVRAVLRGFFRHLYHGMAWSYDAVATLVSLGHWYDWTEAVLVFAHGPRLLELGHGTGHLLERLSAAEDTFAVGLDESREMGMIASHRVASRTGNRPALTRGTAQQLPFEGAGFDSVVSTFPTEFIFDRASISEIHRVLKPNGQLVVLPVAWFAGRRFEERIAAWLFAFTRQVPTAPEEAVRSQLAQPLSSAGFEVALHRIEDRSSTVLVLVATK